MLARVALATEVQHVDRAGQTDETGAFDKRAVALVAVEDLCRFACERVAVFADGLQDDGRGDLRRLLVVAQPAVSDGVAVDFVQQVALTVCVAEGGGVDRAAEVRRAGHGVVGDGVVGPFDAVGARGADAVEAAVAGCVGRGGEVEHEGAIVELEDIGGPDFGVRGVDPGREGAQGVMAFVKAPGVEVGGGGELDFDVCMVVDRLCAEGVPS